MFHKKKIVQARPVLSGSARILPVTFPAACSSRNVRGKHEAWGRKIVLVPG